MKILFVCVENAGRSQMAEGFAKALAPEGVEVFSAGSAAAKAVHPAVVEAMWEKGIDLGSQVPKGFDALPEGVFDWVIGMGCGDRWPTNKEAEFSDGRERVSAPDACPIQRAKQVLAWEIPNPKGQPLETVRQIRDQIEAKVQDLFLRSA